MEAKDTESLTRARCDTCCRAFDVHGAASPHTREGDEEDDGCDGFQTTSGPTKFLVDQYDIERSRRAMASRLRTTARKGQETMATAPLAEHEEMDRWKHLPLWAQQELEHWRVNEAFQRGRAEALEAAVRAVQSDRGAGHLSMKTVDAIDVALNGRAGAPSSPSNHA